MMPCKIMPCTDDSRASSRDGCYKGPLSHDVRTDDSRDGCCKAPTSLRGELNAATSTGTDLRSV